MKLSKIVPQMRLSAAVQIMIFSAAVLKEVADGLNEAANYTEPDTTMEASLRSVAHRAAALRWDLEALIDVVEKNPATFLNAMLPRDVTPGSRGARK